MAQSAIDRAEARRKQREAQQKKLLLVLVPVFIAVVAWQGPKTLKQLRGEQEAAVPAAATATTPAVTTPAPASGETPAAASDPTAVAAAAETTLPDTDEPTPPDEGQIIGFSRFSATDPFVQLVDENTTSTADEAQTPTPTTTTAGTSTPPPSAETPPSTTPVAPPVTASSATVSVNGRVQVLVVGDTFPQSDPAFTLVSISAEAIEIGLADGQFSDGQSTITIRKGESVTLVSQPDGARFTIRFVTAN